MGVEHFVKIWMGKVSVGDMADKLCFVGVPRGKRRLPHYIFRLTNRLHVVRAVFAPVHPAFDENRAGDVVAVGGILPQLRHLIDAAAPVPKVMVGVDDLTIRIDNIFDDLPQPFVTVGHVLDPFTVIAGHRHFPFGLIGRIRPSCATLTASRPSRV